MKNKKIDLDYLLGPINPPIDPPINSLSVLNSDGSRNNSNRSGGDDFLNGVLAGVVLTIFGFVVYSYYKKAKEDDEKNY
jgi:hypothetical protein